MKHFGYKVLTLALTVIIVVIAIFAFAKPAWEPIPPGISFAYGGTTAPNGYLILQAMHRFKFSIT